MNPTMNTVDIVVSDMEAAITFYGRLGLDFTVDAQFPDHAACVLPSGLHLMLDTEKFRGSSQTAGWSRPTGDPRAFFVHLLSAQSRAPGGAVRPHERSKKALSSDGIEPVVLAPE